MRTRNLEGKLTMSIKTNFLHKSGGNYVHVEQSLFGAIEKNFDRNFATAQYSEYVVFDALNLALFFGRAGDIFMSHGVADKNYLLKRGPGNRLLLNDFMAVFVPGPWMKRKLLANPDVKLSAEQIIPVGWPRLDYLFEQQSKSAHSPRSFSKPKVLWAPTHDARKHGASSLTTSSYPAFSEHVEDLGKIVDLSVGLHPRNRPDKAPTGIGLLEADVVISDFGTMVYEAWALGKPVIFPYWLVGEGVKKYRPGSAEAYIFEKKIGYHPNSIEEMVDLLNRPLALTDDVKEFMNDYLPPEFNGRSGMKCAEAMRKLSVGLSASREKRLFEFVENSRRAEVSRMTTERKAAKDISLQLTIRDEQIKKLQSQLRKLNRAHQKLVDGLKTIG